MSVKKEAPTRQAVQLEFEVPGTPEQVWHAIATGQGISSWFVPSEVDERQGGAVAFHLGPGMESSGTVTVWEPPRHFAYEEPDWSPGAPPLATEFTIEARSGRTCVVRLVHSLFGSDEDWSDQFDGFEAGWASFFDVLRLYLTEFFGQECSSFRLMGSRPGSESDAWDALTQTLAITSGRRGDRWRTPSTVPPVGGIIERAGKGKHIHELLVRLDEPAPGIALIGAYTWGGSTHAAISFFFFGDRASAAASRDEPLWQAWMTSQPT